jgi:hypothetical protein
VDFPESTLRAANAGLEKSDAEQGQAAAETFQAIPHPVPEVSFAGVTERNVPGLRDGSPSWEQGLGFHIGGMIGHEFLRSHAVTLDFDGMMVVFH